MLEIKEFNTNTASQRDWHDFHAVMQQYYLEIEPSDLPIGFEPFIRNYTAKENSEGCIIKTFLAYYNGEIAGVAGFSKFEGCETVFLDEVVLAQFRRKKIGTKLLQKLSQAAVEANLYVFTIVTVDNLPSGEAFLTMAGAKKGLVQKGSQLLLKNLDTALMKKWAAFGNKEDIESGIWVTEVPEEHIEKYVSAYNSINDAPHGELQNDFTTMTCDATRMLLKRMRNAGTSKIISWVRDKQTGDVAAISEINVFAASPDIAFQHITVTVPKYRGNGFGKAVKASTALYLIENMPNLRCIRTSNAEVNADMLAINDKMGFQQHQRDSFWELEIKKE